MWSALADGKLARRHVELSAVAAGGAMHERACRAVLEQPTHQIGQQRSMWPDRRIDAKRRTQTRRSGSQCFEQRSSHAVQALKLQPRPRLVSTRKLEQLGDRLGVVSGKLRLQLLAPGQQSARTRKIGDIRVG